MVKFLRSDGFAFYGIALVQGEVMRFVCLLGACEVALADLKPYEMETLIEMPGLDMIDPSHN